MTSNQDATILSQLLSSFNESWPNLAKAIEDYTFPPDSNPTPLLTTIASTLDSPEKIMFCSLLKCFDFEFSVLNSQLSRQSATISEYESNFKSMTAHVNELNESLNAAHHESSKLREAIDHKTQQYKAGLMILIY